MDIRKQLNKENLRPDKQSGQCLLTDESILARIAEAGKLTRRDTVLEVGSGPGNLTRYLSQWAGRVIAVENDPNMVNLLTQNVSALGNIEIVNDDILRWRNNNRQNISHRGYRVVANIPYYLTARLLRVFLGERPQPDGLVLLVQDEVADRLVAAPGALSLLAVSVQYYGQVKKLFRVERSKFWPKPVVDSAVVRIEVRREPNDEDRDFFRLVRIGFSARRKQLHNNLTAGYDISKPEIKKIFDRLNISISARPQDISIAQWIGINSAIKGENLAKIG